MEDNKLDAESVARNKSAGPLEHLEHLLKIGWDPNSPLIKRFLKDNYLSESDVEKILSEINS